MQSAGRRSGSSTAASPRPPSRHAPSCRRRGALGRRVRSPRRSRTNRRRRQGSPPVASVSGAGLKRSKPASPTRSSCARQAAASRRYRPHRPRRAIYLAGRILVSQPPPATRRLQAGLRHLRHTPQRTPTQGSGAHGLCTACHSDTHTRTHT